MGPYIADFACHHARLVIEVDGDSHATPGGYDEARDRFLSEQGYTVLRFSNADAFESGEGVYDRIVAELRSSPSPALPTEGEGVRNVTSPLVGEDGREVRRSERSHP
jgi:very-short-patch-repair endonuclease